ncbi:MAG: hypothetical protein ACSLE3_06550 [Microbacteriaceae bacterium]
MSSDQGEQDPRPDGGVDDEGAGSPQPMPAENPGREVHSDDVGIPREGPVNSDQVPEAPDPVDTDVSVDEL